MDDLEFTKRNSTMKPIPARPDPTLQPGLEVVSSPTTAPPAYTTRQSLQQPGLEAASPQTTYFSTHSPVSNDSRRSVVQPGLELDPREASAGLAPIPLTHQYSTLECPPYSGLEHSPWHHDIKPAGGFVSIDDGEPSVHAASTTSLHDVAGAKGQLPLGRTERKKENTIWGVRKRNFILSVLAALIVILGIVLGVVLGMVYKNKNSQGNEATNEPNGGERANEEVSIIFSTAVFTATMVVPGEGNADGGSDSVGAKTTQMILSTRVHSRLTTLIRPTSTRETAKKGSETPDDNDTDSGSAGRNPPPENNPPESNPNPTKEAPPAPAPTSPKPATTTKKSTSSPKTTSTKKADPAPAPTRQPDPPAQQPKSSVPCTWEGHCVGDYCRDNNDCSSPFPCWNNRCQPQECGHPGRCEYVPCSYEGDPWCYQGFYCNTAEMICRPV